jgi:hypothetical protein
VKVPVAHEVLDVARARQEIVEAGHLVAVVEQPHAQAQAN